MLEKTFVRASWLVGFCAETEGHAVVLSESACRNSNLNITGKWICPCTAGFSAVQLLTHLNDLLSHLHDSGYRYCNAAVTRAKMIFGKVEHSAVTVMSTNTGKEHRWTYKQYSSSTNQVYLHSLTGLWSAIRHALHLKQIWFMTITRSPLSRQDGPSVGRYSADVPCYLLCMRFDRRIYAQCKGQPRRCLMPQTFAPRVCRGHPTQEE